MAYTTVNQNTKDRPTDFIDLVAPADVVSGNLLIVGPWLCVAVSAAKSGEKFTADIREGQEIDCVSSVAVAAAIGDKVYYNPTTGAFAASSATGNALVGYTTSVKDANNNFRIAKVKFATVA